MNEAYIPKRAGCESEHQQPVSELEMSKLVRAVDEEIAWDRFTKLVGVFLVGAFFGAVGLSVVWLIATAGIR